MKIFLQHSVMVPTSGYVGTKYNFQIGTGIQTSQLDNRSIRGIYQTNGKDSVIRTKQSYANLFPTANFTYNFSKRTNLIFHYRGRTNQPTVTQLQDVPDLTNPGSYCYR
ncbi:MAG: outer membrane beta-barrel protein [Ferruginibacter sp.]